jgi:DNA repair ATPase RecN
MPQKVDAAWNDAQRALSESEASLAKLAMEISSFADCPECSDQAIQAMAIIQQFRAEFTETLAHRLEDRLSAVEMFRQAFG